VTDAPKIGETMPELNMLALKLRDDLREIAEVHIRMALDHELPRTGKTQTAHRLAAALVLTSAGVGAMTQMMTVTLAAVMGRAVNPVQVMAYMMLNDGTTPLGGVLERGDELIALAKAHGFQFVEKGEFDPAASMRDHIQAAFDRDPRVRRVIRELADTDPTLAELLLKHGVDVTEKTKQ
jgi:hypothetical protein